MSLPGFRRQLLSRLHMSVFDIVGRSSGMSLVCSSGMLSFVKPGKAELIIESSAKFAIGRWWFGSAMLDGSGCLFYSGLRNRPPRIRITEGLIFADTLLDDSADTETCR